MRAAARVGDWRRRNLLRSGGLQNLNGLLPEEFHVLDVVRMALRCDAHCRQTPIVLDVRVKIDAIRLKWQLSHETSDRHPVVGFFSKRLLVSGAPARRIGR